ncbi:apolipoprotein D [Salmo salar]|uniref:Apolipoprotein D n=1 Tax=Salmo salar TaxID=8030 RepID=A0A1S3LVF4_SALSA|nr:apolipoprotein D [Salmo salar]
MSEISTGTLQRHSVKTQRLQCGVTQEREHPCETRYPDQRDNRGDGCLCEHEAIICPRLASPPHAPHQCPGSPLGALSRTSRPACLQHEKVLPYSSYWIISTDYENSALVYSCTDVLRLFHMDFAWILGRTRTLPVATIDKAREIFTSSNIDVSRMVTSRQQGCDKTL